LTELKGTVETVLKVFSGVTLQTVRNALWV